MRIQQAYISYSVADFPWLVKLGLRPYDNPDEPAVFFGMYRPEDMEALRNHKSFSVVRWCGSDSISVQEPNLFKSVINVSLYPQMIDVLKGHGIDCRVIPMENIYGPAWVSEYGPRIYAYSPLKSGDYYGQSIINKLVDLGYDILIGDGTIPRGEWDNGKADEIYSQCYIGMVLSPYCGGAGSIIELGLRGRMCITNVNDVPNAIPWKSIGDIIYELMRERNEDPYLIAEATREALKEAEWLNTNFYK